jgi:hypothetical protein
MGKAFSPLQQDILAVLDEWPSFEEAKALRPGSLAEWALPRDIVARLGKIPNAASQASVSRALARLYQRGVIARAWGELAIAGTSYRYLRIADQRNAGTGKAGPELILGFPRPRTSKIPQD